MKYSLDNAELCTWQISLSSLDTCQQQLPNLICEKKEMLILISNTKGWLWTLTPPPPHLLLMLVLRMSPCVVSHKVSSTPTSSATRWRLLSSISTSSFEELAPPPVDVETEDRVFVLVWGPTWGDIGAAVSSLMAEVCAVFLPCLTTPVHHY